MLSGRKILLGITGSIAAYKSAWLARELQRRGAEVRVVMTPASIDFITPLTLATLTGHRVYSDYTEDADQGTWTNHVELGMWADLFLIAPVTANTLSSFVTGNCAHFLQAVFLSSKCPVMVAPAMDLDMFAHPSTQENLTTLTARGVEVIEPGNGPLASGLEGKGRMAEPDDIADAVEEHFQSRAPLHGKTVVVTLGPTHEPIDAVRYIGNRSSGKMGLALVEVLLLRGANVHVVAGPVQFDCPKGVTSWQDVETAKEMHDAALPLFAKSDIGIAVAAVADVRPAMASVKKLRRSDLPHQILLEDNPDILKSWGDSKTEDQFLVGFALEDENGMQSAQRKMDTKNLDFIVLNELSDDGAGFQTDTNKITLVTKGGEVHKFGLKPKPEVAADILDTLQRLLNA
ncbi:MAG: bifunctional phosphopantothenoylcysteine decarboxylase/phosphopantothenate--cysteine ligase CoaBC [Flavobacteriales bacterium]